MSFSFDDADQKNYTKMLSQCDKANILPNYFARYALTKDIKDPFSLPRDDITDNDIKDAISKLKGFWNKNKNNPKYTTILQQLLDESTKAKSVLLDKDARNAHKKLAVDEHFKRLKERYKLLDKLLKKLVTEGSITTNELDYIYTKLSNKLSKEDIDGHIQEKNIRVIPTPPPEPLPPMLEPTIMQNIRKQLNVFNVNTLYDFLGLSEDDSIGKTQEAYFNLTNDWNKKPVSGEKTAAQGILGQVKTQLIEGDAQKYINGLLFEAMGKLEISIDTAFLDGVLEEDEFADLLSEAKAERIEDDFAKVYILDEARKRKIIVLPPGDSDTVQCPNCYSQNDPSNEYCKNCKESLYIICPKCKRRQQSSNNACTGCGFDFGIILKVKSLREECRALRSKGQLKEALDSLIEIKKLWGSDAEIEKKISELEDAIKRLDTIYSSYDSALSDKKLYKAKEDLRKLRNLSPDYVVKGKTLDEMVSSINAELKKVEDGVQRAIAQERRDENNEAYRTYENLLRLCRDCPDVIEGLRRIRPEPPQGVSISYRPGVVSLNWEKSSSIGELTYHVMRKEGSKPTSVSDGILITKTEYLAVEDTKGEIGHNYYYGIFTERKGAFSLNCATTACVLLYDNVKNFTLRQGDGIVEGSWDLPGNVKRVVIYKKEGAAPSDVGDGEEIPVLGLTKFVDKKVQNGHSYFYKAFCEFVDHKGSKVSTDGIEAAATPNSPPPALLNFTVSKEQSEVIIKWTPLEKGSVCIYKSSNALAYKEGKILSKSEMSTLGTLLSSSGRGYVIDNAPGHGICFYTPVTHENDFAVIGRTQKLTLVEDVSKLRAENLRSYIRLRWKWPVGCTQVLVSWRHDTCPVNAEDTKANKELFTKAQYELKGCFPLDNPIPKKYLFKVFAGYRNNEEVLYSSAIGPEAGAEVNVQGSKIKYRIKKSTFRAKYQVVVRSDTLIEELPELVLVARSGKVPPLSIHDGVELVRIDSESVGPEKSCTAELTTSELPRPCYLKAFFSDDSSYDQYQIVHPSRKEVYIK